MGVIDTYEGVMGFEITEQESSFLKKHEKEGVLRIPNSIEGLPVLYIMERALVEFRDIHTVVLNRSLLGTGSEFLMGTNVKEVHVGPSLWDVAPDAFQGAWKLTNFYVSKDNPQFMALEGSLCTKDGKVLIAGGVTVPEGVELIAPFAFSNKEIASIRLPESLITIDAGAFHECTLLAEVDTSEAKNLQHIMDRAFERCVSLEEISIPESIQEIGPSAFGYTALKELTLRIEAGQRKRRTKIDSFAFECSAIESITLDAGLGSIALGAHSFHRCKSKELALSGRIYLENRIFLSNPIRRVTFSSCKLENLHRDSFGLSIMCSKTARELSTIGGTYVLNENGQWENEVYW